MPLRSISQILLILVACSPFSPPTAVRTLDSAIGLKEFGQLLTSLSEPEGYFDSDNFVSNEAAYLRVLPALNVSVCAEASTSASARTRITLTSRISTPGWQS